MKTRIRNVTLTVLSALALFTGLFVFTPPPSVPEVTPTTVAQSPRPGVRHSAHVHRPPSKPSPVTAEEEMHEDCSHSGSDPAHPSGPPIGKHAPQKPSGPTEDDRDLLLVTLDNSDSLAEKRKAIAKLARSWPKDPEVRDTLRGLLHREANEKVKAQLLSSLSKTGMAELASDFESIALGSGSLFLKRRAVIALQHLPREQALFAALRIAEQGDSGVRSRAVQMLIKHFPQEPEVEVLMAERG